MQKKVDSCSPTSVLEDLFRTEEFETACSSKPPTTGSSNNQSSKQTSRWHGFAQLLGFGSKKPLLGLRRSSSVRENATVSPDFLANSANSYNLKSPGRVFTLSQLQIATKNFSAENIIGKGGYAEVYKGSLHNGKLVAIKRLTKGTPDDIIGDFLSELGIMAHVNHPNTAKLIGYGIEGRMHLVLELSPNGSLASLLYGSKSELKWDIRFKIAQGTAEGLRYLHEGCKRRIIHRDIKAANILLTNNFEPQICDFGLAKWLPENLTHHTVSKFEGTFGYLAPEYLMHGIVDEKTDVFAFGVLLLELVTGRRALDYSQQSLVLWAKPLLRNNDIRELIDPAIGEEYDSREMNLVLLAASLCIHRSSVRRPRMNQVVLLLNGNLNSLKSMRKCRIPFFRKALHEETLNAEGSDKS
ncbi:receptor-like cytosolic serine/threonine-protein kinase RBK2 [Hibiscus syriacus]|uniref:receptor-like cytosolic serine/threonine-protein kinase RBK2 n=1 Tax=Hibiscus syriacus TaxID=106335 RepID=UPI001923A380|nr:receptor-like cytosolic serine/threonine-protein kinase RBK2 [Hibiscus syriacus]